MGEAYRPHIAGLIARLSEDLHATPGAFLRELIANAADALEARSRLDPDHHGSITIEVFAGPRPAIAFLDDGIGMTRDEAEGLALIGMGREPGRFGIGLLSAFAVADEVAIVTRSAREGQHTTLEWRGRIDGSTSLRALDRDIAPGTQVYLRCKAGCEATFDPPAVRTGISRYGAMIPHPIRVIHADEATSANPITPPWRRRFTSTEQQARELEEFGRAAMGIAFFDAVPIKCKAGGIEGVAYILPDLAELATVPGHRIYHRSLFLSAESLGLLPPWADFVRLVVNVDSIGPTLGRESFRRGTELREARESIGSVLRDYLVGLAARAPQRLLDLLAIHGPPIWSLASRDEELRALILEALVERSHQEEGPEAP